MSLNGWIKKIKAAPKEVTRLIPPARISGYAQSFDGVPIYWELHGPEKVNSKFKPMVFCYGLVCSMNQWRYQLERYSQDHWCLLVDYRGHHHSGAPDDTRALNISALARDIACAIDAQSYSGNYHVWGHSLGCNVAIELAAAYPERIATLNLCCGTLDNPFKRMLHSDFLEKVLTPVLGTVPLFPELFYTSWDVMFMRPEIAKLVVQLGGFNLGASKAQDVDTYIEAVASVAPKVFFTLLAELSRGNTRGIAPRVNAPTNVIAGSKDHVTPLEAQMSMAQTLPNANYIEIATGSHNVQLDFGEYVCLKVEEVWKARKLW